MAARFWVGGSGTWDSTTTTNWSATSGGAGGASAPTIADNVTFDSNSGTSATVTVASTAVALNTTINKSDINLSFSGNATLTGTGGQFLLTTGTITLNSYTLTCVFFNTNNSNTRTIAFGTGNITVTGSGTTVWSAATLTGLTITGTPVVNCTYAGGTATRTINHGSTAGGSASTAISAIVSAGTDGLNPVGYFVDLNLTGYAGPITSNNRVYYGNLILSAGCSYTSGSHTESFLATSGTQNITTAGKTINNVIFNGVGGTFQLQDNCTVGSTRTVTLTNGTLDLNNLTLSCGIFSSSNSNARSIAFGTGNITLTGNNATIVDFSTATNFTRTGTPTINLTYSGSTGTRVVSLGSTAGGSETNTLNYNFTAGTDTIGIGSGSSVGALDFTGFTGTFNFGTATRTYYGNITLVSGMTVVGGTGVATFASTSGAQQITTAGKTLDLAMNFNGVGGTFAFQDALTQGSTRTTTLTNGTLKLKAGVTSTVGSFATSGTNQKYLQSTLAGSQATLSDASGTNSLSYTTIQDINATGGATWNAYYANGNIDGGNNTNWNFGGTPSYDAEYGYKLRSFTETGRF